MNTAAAVDAFAKTKIIQIMAWTGVVSGKIKPVSSGSSVTPSEVSDLTLRIENLENNKADKGDYYTKDEIDDKLDLTSTSALPTKSISYLSSMRM